MENSRVKNWANKACLNSVLFIHILYTNGGVSLFTKQANESCRAVHKDCPDVAFTCEPFSRVHEVFSWFPLGAFVSYALTAASAKEYTNVHSAESQHHGLASPTVRHTHTHTTHWEYAERKRGANSSSLFLWSTCM